MNESSKSEHEDQTETGQTRLVDILLFLIACLLSVFICTGNVLTILAIAYTSSLRTLANIYVTSLAVADFIVGLVVTLVALYLLPTTRILLFYRFINVCILMYGLNLGMTAVSAIHMTVIAIDRYLYISQPYFHQRVITTKVVVSCVCFAWTFGIFYSVLPQFIHKPYSQPPICDVTKLMPIQYLFYTTASVYWALVVVIIVMYSLILHTALKQRKAIHSTGSNSGSDGRERTTIKKSRLKSVKFFLTVFGVFFTCLTPIIICMGLDYFTNVPAEAYRFFNLLALANSGMNFIIYGIHNREFRAAVFKMLRVRPVCPRTQLQVFSVSHSKQLTSTHF